MLAFSKYADFLLSNCWMVMPAWIVYPERVARILLPMGISFYTFQSLSYTIDVYRGRASLANPFLDFAAYVSFFPQLVAGPIIRSSDFLPQPTENHSGASAAGFVASCALVRSFAR